MGKRGRGFSSNKGEDFRRILEEITEASIPMPTSGKWASAGESIENHPEEVKDRETFGHWEMDTVKGKQGITKSCMLVLTERKTRDEIIIKMPDQKAASVMEALDRLERKWGICSQKCLEVSSWTMGWSLRTMSG